MIERLLELMRMKNLTSSQLADAIGVQRSGISHFVSGRNKPSLEFILKILNYFPDVNPDWILFGKNPIFRNESLNSAASGDQILPAESSNISEDKTQIDPQSSFLGELFSGSIDTEQNRSKEIKRTIAKQEAKLQPSKIKSDDTLKNDTVEYEKTTPGLPDRGSTIEKVLVFYKNRKFREYLPE